MGPVAGNVSHNRNLATANLLAISNLAFSAMQRRMSGKIMKALSRVQLSPLGPYDARSRCGRVCELRHPAPALDALDCRICRPGRYRLFLGSEQFDARFRLCRFDEAGNLGRICPTSMTPTILPAGCSSVSYASFMESFRAGSVIASILTA